MKELITDHPDVFAGWVANRVGMTGSWGSYYAMGLVDTDKNAIVAGVVMHDFNGSNAVAHIAMDQGVGRAMIKLFKAVCDYAFRQCKMKRLTGLVPASKPRVLAFDKKLGFEEEFVIPCGAEDGDMHMLVLWPHKCRWLAGGSDDKQN